jgi:mannosyltransferase
MTIEVVLDCIVFDLQRSGGISRYWVNLISALAELPAGPRLHLLINEKASSGPALEVMDRARANPRLTLHPYKTRALERMRQPAIPKQLRSHAVFHSSYYRSAARMPNVLTVHDFTYENLVGGWRAFAQLWQKSRAAAASSAVVCVSESTRQDFKRRFPNFDAGPIEVIHHGVEAHFTPSRKLSEGMHVQGDYVLFVGRRDPYKNFWCAVEAVRQLESMKLTVVGPSLSVNEQARLDAELEGRYTMRPHVDDAELVELYRNAFALAYPSRYEGFGLPVLEAMACGCPAVALRASSIPEVAGNGAVMLDEATPEALRRALEKIQRQDFRGHLVERGLRQAARFRWADAAAEYFAVYAAAHRSAARLNQVTD